MLNHLFAVLMLAGGLAQPLSAPAARPATTLAATSATLDPTVYFLDDSELPAGFVHDPSEDKTGAQPGVVVNTRFYDTSGRGFVNLIAYATDAPEGAKRYYDELVQNHVQQQGLAFTPIDDLGAEGTVGYADKGTLFGYEQHAVFFRRGTMTGGLTWFTTREVQPREAAIMLARAMDARVARTQNKATL